MTPPYQEFLMHSVLPAVHDFVTAVSTVSARSEEVTDADTAVLELIYVLIQRYNEVMLHFYNSKSSDASMRSFAHAVAVQALKNVVHGHTDQSVALGMRVVERLCTLDVALSRCLDDLVAHIVAICLDTVHSVHFFAAQNAIGTVLHTIYKLYSDTFRLAMNISTCNELNIFNRTQLQAHAIGQTVRGQLLSAENVTRPLVLKTIIFLNMDWQKERDE